MLQPKRTKFRKAFKGRIHGAAKGGTNLDFGQFGLKAQEPERITARQIEAARRALTRAMKRAGRVWIRIFPDLPVSKKPIRCSYVRPELLRLSKRGNNKNCQPAVRSRGLIPVERHRDQQWRTGPVHRSPATEAEDDGGKDS